jgi:transposase-like protein
MRMSKQSMREEAERLIRETMARKALVVKQGNTRIETVCGKCGAPNRISAKKGETRVKFVCKHCGHKQETL